MCFSVFLSNTNLTFSTHFSDVQDTERKSTGFVSYTMKATRFGQLSSPSKTAALVSPVTFSASFWFFNSSCRMQEGGLQPLLHVTPWTISFTCNLGGVVQVVKAANVVALLQLIKQEENSCMEWWKLSGNIFFWCRHILKIKWVSVAIFANSAKNLMPSFL